MRIETQQQQSGWAMDGRTKPRSVAIETFVCDARQVERETSL